MVKFVNMAVEGTIMQCLMGDEVIKVFEDEETGDLETNGSPVGEGSLPSSHAKEFGEWMEKPDAGEFYGEMREKNELGAFPLLFWRRYFVWLELPLAEVWDSVDYYPWDTSSKIYNLYNGRKEVNISIEKKRRKKGYLGGWLRCENGRFRRTSCRVKLSNPVAMIGSPK
ncbi:hypothetical protein FRC18_011376 [Serendipita sp. 400]|nr:hypothetical protein FRC18_011376 [Serendipita sp. 400]